MAIAEGEHMRKMASASIVGLLATLQAAAAQPTEGVTVSRVARTEFNYANWSGTRGSDLRENAPGRGQQLYSSAVGELAAEKPGAFRFEADVRTGHVLSQHMAGGATANYAGLLDTQIAATLTFLQSNGFRPFIGIAANVPTGRSALPTEKRLTRMDSDLVAVPAYGEGTNINPSAGATFAPFKNFTLAYSAGYAFRGRFEQEASNGLHVSSALRVLAPQERTTVTPGDMLNASATASYQAEAWNGAAVFAFIDQSELKVNDTPIAKQGVRYAVNANANILLANAFTLRLAGSWSFAEKNAYAADGVLMKEALNSNSHVVTASVRPAMSVGSITIGPQYGYLYRDQNFYNLVDALFVPAKTKHSAGFFMEANASNELSFSLDVTKFWVREAEGSGATDPQLNPIPLSYTGYSAILSAQLRF